MSSNGTSQSPESKKSFLLSEKNFVEGVSRFRLEISKYCPKYEKSLERSQLFRKKGNDLFSSKKYKEAIILYNAVSKY